MGIEILIHFVQKVTTIANHYAVHFHAHHRFFDVTMGYFASPVLSFVKLVGPSSRSVTAGFHSISLRVQVMQAISRCQSFLLIKTLLVCLVSLVFCAGKGITFAGTVEESQSAWHEKYRKQENAPDPKEMLLNTDPEPDMHEGFTPLFNGKDLSGWTPKGGTCTFEVVDGMLVGTCVPGSPSTYLSTEKNDYQDFIFTCDMKWEVDGNSGVMFRAQSKTEKDKEIVFGPQAEMEGITGDRYWSGGYLWPELRRIFLPCLVKGT